MNILLPGAIIKENGKEVHLYVTDIDVVKGLGFCVSVAHAQFMARYFNTHGIPSMALTGDSPDEERNAAKQRLVSGELRFLFVVDIYNEGVDIPEVNTVLFLRPTESLTVFLQQLGRGLRLAENKDCLTVLDFIGQANKKYNFEEKFAALLSNTTRSVSRELKEGFVSAPKGCYIQLEKIAAKYVLDNISVSYDRTSGLVARAAAFTEDTGLSLTLGNFLDYYHLDPRAIYSKKVCFSRLCVRAGAASDFAEPLEETMTKAFARFAVIDSRRWIHFLLELLPELDNTDFAALPPVEQRMLHLDETSFVYVKGNFEPIVSEALWHECEHIRKSRISSLRLPDGETRRKGARTTKNLWVSKLRCRCGSSYRIFNWRKLKDGTPVFGYQCNMRTVNPTRSFVLEHNMTQQLSCDAISIPEWKLELMAKKIFEKVWGNQNKAILRACKMIESCQNGKAATRMSAAPIQSKIEKIKKRKLNYAAMRADGELPREEYQALCKQADDEIARLEQELKALSPAPEPQTVSSDMKAIYDFLSQKVDVHSARLAPELIDQFVEVVTPFADYSYRWKLNTGCKKSKEERTNLTAVSEKPILTFTIDF